MIFNSIFMKIKENLQSIQIIMKNISLNNQKKKKKNQNNNNNNKKNSNNKLKKLKIIKKSNLQRKRKMKYKIQKIRKKLMRMLLVSNFMKSQLKNNIRKVIFEVKIFNLNV